MIELIRRFPGHVVSQSLSGMQVEQTLRALRRPRQQLHRSPPQRRRLTGVRQDLLDLSAALKLRERLERRTRERRR
jgi:hypothetical protein